VRWSRVGHLSHLTTTPLPRGLASSSSLTGRRSLSRRLSASHRPSPLALFSYARVKHHGRRLCLACHRRRWLPSDGPPAIALRPSDAALDWRKPAPDNSPPADYEPPPPAALARRRLSECISDSDEMEQLAARGLVVDDRDQMDDFMSFATETADCGPCPLSRSTLHSAGSLAMSDLLLLPLLLIACRDGRRGRRPPHPAQPRQRWPATGRERPPAPPTVHLGASVLLSASDTQRSWCADSALLYSCPASSPVLDLAHAAFGAPRSPRPSHGTLV
jgi:hypothetical protein